MAAGWVKSLQCKSRAYEDVVTATSCRNKYQNLKDVIDKPKPRPKPRPENDPFSAERIKRYESVKSKPKMDALPSSSLVRRTVSAPISKLNVPGSGSGLVGPFFPSVTELQEGHTSRNVVEIIFQTRWGPKGFSGRIEMVFKVHNSARLVTRFEEYRDVIKIRAESGAGGRCVADGNEMMRFHSLGSTNKINSCDGVSKIDGGKSVKSAVGLCTFSGSGAAHDSAGGEKGRRAMVVCRVIAGRVSKRSGLTDPSVNKRAESECEFDSVSWENGELLVFDSRAVLPCFLVIYKL